MLRSGGGGGKSVASRLLQCTLSVQDVISTCLAHFPQHPGLGHGSVSRQGKCATDACCCGLSLAKGLSLRHTPREIAKYNPVTYFGWGASTGAVLFFTFRTVKFTLQFSVEGRNPQGFHEKIKIFRKIVGIRRTEKIKSPQTAKNDEKTRDFWRCFLAREARRFFLHYSKNQKKSTGRER